MSPETPRPWILYGTSLAVGLFTFALLVSTAGSIGVTWDEPIYSEAAERAARWLGLVIRGRLAQAFEPTTFGLSWGLVNEHPPLVRILNGLGWAGTRNWLPAPVSHRVGTMVLAGAVLGALYGFLARQRHPRVALMAVAAWLTMPRLFFHMHLNTLDFPVAAAWILATGLFYVHFRPPRPRPTASLWAGVGLGLTLLTKITGVLLVPFWGMWLLLYRRTPRHLLLLALSGPVALAVLYLGWPWIWQDPVGGLLRWVRFFQDHYEIRQWFAGQLYVDTPWFVPLAVVAITTPVPLLVLAGVGAVQGIRWRAGLPRVEPWIGLHLLGVATVLGYYALPFTTPIHDQERLLLPGLAHLTILAGEGFDRLWQVLAPRVQRGTLQAVWGQGILALLLLLPGAVDTARLHPLQLAYYNRLVGGLRGAQELGMETTYFAATYGEFLPWLDRLPPRSTLWVMPNSWDVIYYYQRQGLVRDDLVLLRPPGWGSFYDDRGVPFAVGTLADADYALIERRQTTFNRVIPEYAPQLEWVASRPELARVEREGVVLASLHAADETRWLAVTQP